jgi:hypothetical protein
MVAVTRQPLGVRIRKVNEFNDLKKATDDADEVDQG